MSDEKQIKSIIAKDSLSSFLPLSLKMRKNIETPAPHTPSLNFNSTIFLES